MKRLILGLTAALGVAGAAVAQAPTPPAGGTTPAPTTPAPTSRAASPVAAFNVALLMKKFDKWQYYAVTMENSRVTAAIELLKMRNEIVSTQEAMQKETEKSRINQYMEVLRKKQFDFEKREKELKDELDTTASKHLKELFADVNAVVGSVVEANGYDMVFAYPEATTKEEAESQNYIDLKLRATAAQPWFVSKRVDITQAMIDALNKWRPAPGKIPEPIKMPDLKDFKEGKSGITPTGGMTAPAPK